jgi:putative flippase GtrA
VNGVSCFAARPDSPGTLTFWQKKLTFGSRRTESSAWIGLKKFLLVTRGMAYLLTQEQLVVLLELIGAVVVSTLIALGAKYAYEYLKGKE